MIMDHKAGGDIRKRDKNYYRILFDFFRKNRNYNSVKRLEYISSDDDSNK